MMMNTMPAPQDLRFAAPTDLLAAQGAYFVFRMLDGIATLATGVSRDVDRFDANGLFLARTLKTLLQHGEALPPFERVLPATQALAHQLFHISVTEREQFAPAMVLAWNTAFGTLRDRPVHPDDSESALLQAFQRALDDHASAQPAQPPRAFLAVQLQELCQMVHDELTALPPAPVTPPRSTARTQ